MAKSGHKKTGHSHEYERLNPGAVPGNPHRPETSYGMDKGKAGGTYGDAENTPGDDDDDLNPGGQSPEKVSERPNVSTVRPEDYPLKDRKDSQA